MNQNVSVNGGLNNETIIPDFDNEYRELHPKIFLEAVEVLIK